LLLHTSSLCFISENRTGDLSNMHEELVLTCAQCGLILWLRPLCCQTGWTNTGNQIETILSLSYCNYRTVI